MWKDFFFFFCIRMILKCLCVTIWDMFSKMFMIMGSVSLAYVRKNHKWTFAFDFFLLLGKMLSGFICFSFLEVEQNRRKY